MTISSVSICIFTAKSPLLLVCLGSLLAAPGFLFNASFISFFPTLKGRVRFQLCV